MGRSEKNDSHDGEEHGEEHTEPCLKKQRCS